MGDRGHNTHGLKRRGLLCPFRGGSWVPVLHNVAWAEVYFRTKWLRLHPFTCLATIDMAENWGLCPFTGRSCDPI